MKRRLFQPAILGLWKQTVLAVPAAALMLGQSYAGTSIGINFWGNFYGSYNGGRAVSATAFGIGPANWYTTPPAFDPDAANSTMMTGPGGTLNLTWAAPYTGVSWVDPTNAPALSQGDSDVLYGFLDGGQLSTDPGYSVNLSGLAALFPSGYIVQAMAAADVGNAFTTNTVSDGITTQRLVNPVAGRTTLGGAYALGQGSGAFVGDTLSLSAPAATTSLLRSALAGFLVTDQPVISARPTGGGAFSSGATFTLQATAVGLRPLSYQWRLNGNAILGATTNQYTVSSASGADAGVYDVVVTNAYGAGTSDVVSVQVTALPVILRDISSQTNYLSMMASFSVDAGGAAPLSYQWSKDGNPIDGATNSVLTLAGLQSSDAADYEVVVTNNLGAATSSMATLAVLTNLPPYEGFNYTNGTLSGAGSDPAWGGPWAQTATGYNGENAVFQPGAAYQSGAGTLLVSGGAAELAASGSEDYENVRNLLATLGGPAGGTVYFSFLGQITNTPWAGVELVQDGAGRILLGASSYARNWGWGDRPSTNTLCRQSSVTSDTFALLVYRFDFTPTNTLVRLYVNPSLGAEPAIASVSGSWTNFQFNQVRLVAHGQFGIGTGPNGFIDELRLGGSWASVTPAQLVIAAGAPGVGHSLVWNYGTLQASGALGTAALWTNVPNAFSPYPLPAAGPGMFYRLGSP